MSKESYNVNTNDTVLVINETNIEQKKSALSHKFLSHYTTIENLEKILKNHALKFTNIRKLQDISEQNSVKKIYNRNFYTLSLTHSSQDDKKMWENFGGNKGAKITYFFNSNVKDLIDHSKLAKGYRKNNLNILLRMTGCKENRVYEDSLLENEVLIDLYYKDVLYSPKKQLKEESNYNMKDSSRLDLFSSTTYVKDIYKYQEETRITAILMGHKRIHKIDYLLLPINFDEIKSLEIELSKNCTNEDIEKIKKITKNKKIYIEKRKI